MLILLLTMACTDPADTGSVHDTGGNTETRDSGTVVEDLEIVGIEAKMRNALSYSHASGIQVAVWYQGRVAYTGNFGTAHPEQEVEVTDDTLFHMGSIQKHVTAALALQQVDAGLMAMDSHPHDVIGDWELAAAPSWSQEATLHDLLSHRGGLADYYDTPTETDDDHLLDHTRGFVAEQLFPLAPADSFYNYSNANFSIAGAMTEVAGAAHWADLLQHGILDPLGMTRTIPRKADVIQDGLYATGYGQLDFSDYNALEFLGEWPDEYGVLAIEDVWESAFARPAGLIWTTAADVARFEGFLMNGDSTVLSDELRAGITTAHSPVFPAWDFLGYGYGLLIYDEWNSSTGWQDTELWLHDGSTGAYGTATVMLPEHDLAVVILSNGYGAIFMNEALEIAATVADLPDGGDVPDLAIVPDDLSPLTGTWHDPHTMGDIIITAQDGALMIEMPDVEAAGFDVDEGLNIAATDVWTMRIDGWTVPLSFWDGPDGTDNHYLASRFFVGERPLDVHAQRVAPDPSRVAGLLERLRSLPWRYSPSRTHTPTAATRSPRWPARCPRTTAPQAGHGGEAQLCGHPDVRAPGR